jgi:hypothetical protein
MSDIPIIADSILNGDVIAFIGAGISASAKNPYTHKDIKGLPLASTLVKLLSNEKSYIDNNLNFGEACFLLKNREGKIELINFLKTHLEEIKSPLPAHQLLADIPFEMFISMNFDCLLEEALKEKNKKTRTITKNSDISLLRNNELPVIKPHGCFSNEDTIIASIDDEQMFLYKNNFSIVDSYIKAKLANKVILFLGFGLADNDFKEMHKQLKNELGSYMSKSYAVKLYPSEFEKDYWKEQQVNIIDKDIGEFLKELKDTILQRRYY